MGSCSSGPAPAAERAPRNAWQATTEPKPQRSKQQRILFLGLRDAGKTALIHRLANTALGPVPLCASTTSMRSHVVSLPEGRKAELIDTPGALRESDAMLSSVEGPIRVAFLADAASPHTLGLAGKLLASLTARASQLAQAGNGSAPDVYVVLTKCDLPEYVGRERAVELLGLERAETADLVTQVLECSLLDEAKLQTATAALLGS